VAKRKTEPKGSAKAAGDRPREGPSGRRLLRPTALGRELGVTRDAVAKMRVIGLPHAAKDSKGYLYDPDEVRLWRARNMRTQEEADRKSFSAEGSDGDDPVTTLNDARIRLTVEQAAMTALKRKQLEGELVEKDRVVSELGILLGAARAAIDQMPDSASRDICDALGVAYAEKGPMVREAIRKAAVSLLKRLCNAADAADAMRAEVEG
jgi:phage terminase Nu1 subunit (DNA packaging protein)